LCTATEAVAKENGRELERERGEERGRDIALLPIVYSNPMDQQSIMKLPKNTRAGVIS